jgi:hypothetical protein
MRSYEALPLNNQPTFIPESDEQNTKLAECAANWGLARDESMDVSNDPRFFAKSVMDKRLGAFKSLTIVSSLMFGTSLKQLFALKKNMNFAKCDHMVGCIAYWQIGGFAISVFVAVMCLLSLYVIAHQFFYANRLMTSGPTGFEQASVFYLTRVIVMWRHVAIKALFSSLWWFMVLIGIQLFVKFYKDADAKLEKPHMVFIANVVGGFSVDDKHPGHINPGQHHKLDMGLHSAIAYLVLLVFLGCASMLYVIRKQHLTVFQENYKAVKVMTHPLESTMRMMSHRSGHLLET